MWARTWAPYVGTDLGMARASLLYSKQVFLFQFLVIDRRKDKTTFLLVFFVWLHLYVLFHSSVSFFYILSYGKDTLDRLLLL